MTEIVKYQGAAPAQRPSSALSLAQMTPQDAWKFAEVLSGSSLLPRQYQGQPSSVLWALEYGRAIGLDVITTIQSVHVIQGRATASSDLMASLTRRAGHRMRILGDDTRAEVTIFRADDPEFPFTVEWTMQRAQKAKLERKDTWQQYPAAMLRARAISECVRMACPEVLHGSIYTPEEVGANVDADGVPVDAEMYPLRPAAVAPARPQNAAQGRDYLHEAHQAHDAETVRSIYRAAKQDGARPEYLAQIADIGKQMAQPEPDEEPADAESVDGPTDEPAVAEQRLRAAAAAAGLENVDTEFEQSYGLSIADAGATQLNEMADLLTGAAA